MEGAEQGAVVGQAGQGRAREGGHRHRELGQVPAPCTVTSHEPTRAGNEGPRSFHNHQIKDKKKSDSNLSPVAHEISSWEALKGGTVAEG